MDRVAFRDVSAVRETADREFSRIEAVINSLLPDACIEHVGGTALPRGITKGDLDIQVRVCPDVFQAARAALDRTFAPDPDNVWGDGAASFKVEDADIPTGIHLTEIGGAFDFQWRYRDLLISRPDLACEYDGIKRRFEGKAMVDYRNAKAAFFERMGRLIGNPPVDSVRRG